MQKRVNAAFAVSCALLSGEVLAAADCVAVFGGKTLSVKMFAAAWVFVFGILYVLFGKKGRKLVYWAAAVMTAACVMLAAGFGCWYDFSRNAQYEDVDSGKAQLYANKRVVVIVPHEDDEINLMGGVMEEYLKYGSEVYAVFVTNGDFDYTGDVRITEAVAAMGNAGLPEDHLIFLGYGDQWAEGGPHLYNGEPGRVIESAAGRKETYGTLSHPAYRQGRSYTSDHFLDDLKSVILEYRPDVIFCSDYDKHIDHRAVSLAFEKAMGALLKQEPDYRPMVFKGYAYGTAWAAEPDYYTENIRSTQNVYEEPVVQEPEIYRWEERIRLPVRGGLLSRSLLSSELYQTLSKHASQNAGAEAVKIINGDKVFWYRDTKSVLYSADVEVSSGDASRLNDFQLVDDHCLTDEQFLPYDGVWIPELEDSQKKVCFTLAEPSDIGELVFYDHPSEEDNILEMMIIFDDGSVIRTAALDPKGCASVIAVDKKEVQRLEIQITRWEGGDAGLSEVEAFEQPPVQDLPYIKLMDEAGNFLYDCRTPADGNMLLSLYSGGQAPAESGENYTVCVDGGACDVQWTESGIAVHCPAGEAAVITVTDREGSLADSIVVRNPGAAARAWSNFWQKAEESVLPAYHSGEYQKTVLYRLLSKVFA